MDLNWFRKLFKRHNPSPEWNLNDPANWETNLLAPRSGVGGPVSAARSLGLPAVYSAVRLISETAASLPLHVYRRTDKGREKAIDRPVYKVLHDNPNPHMTSFGLREMWSTQLLLQGDAFGLITRNNAQEVVRIDWLDSDRTRKDPSSEFYWFTREDGSSQIIPERQVVHIRGPGSVDGVNGQSVIAYAANTIWSGLAAQEFGSAFFANAARPGLAIELPEGVSMDRDERREFKRSFEAKHAGARHVGKAVLVPGGAKLRPISIPAREAQYVETMKFGLEDIARAFRLPPHMIGAMDNAIKANIEEQGIDFVRHSMTPWLVRIEQELNRKLFRGSGFFCEHNVDGLLRGDAKSRYEVYAIGKMNGILTTNDILELENRNTIGNKGDLYTVQSAMMPLETLERMAKDAKNPPKPTPPPPPATPPNGQDDDQVAEAFNRSIVDRLNQKEKRALATGRKSKNIETWLEKFLTDHTSFVEKELRGLVTGLGKTDEGYIAQKAAEYVAALRAALDSNTETVVPWTVEEIREL